MEKFKRLGFKQPEVLVNQYGIEIYVGSDGEDDWCVKVPKEILRKKLEQNGVPKKYLPQYFNQDYCAYLISEDEALKIAEEYTKLASA